MDLEKAFIEAEKTFENLEKEFSKANCAEKTAIKKLARKLIKRFQSGLGILTSGAGSEHPTRA